jgi:hypothetical protein
MCNIWHTSNTPKLNFSSPLAKQNEIQNESKKLKSAIMGETITFSVCNKPFKPLSIPNGRVKSSLVRVYQQWHPQTFNKQLYTHGLNAENTKLLSTLETLFNNIQQTPSKTVFFLITSKLNLGF